MKLNDLPQTSTWTLARRAERMNPSVIREILKVTEKPGIISLAGGLPSPKTFPIESFAAAAASVLANEGASALQYAASEGHAPLREAIAQSRLACALELLYTTRSPVKTVAHRVPTIVSVSDLTTAKAVRRARFAEQGGANVPEIKLNHITGIDCAALRYLNGSAVADGIDRCG